MCLMASARVSAVARNAQDWGCTGGASDAQQECGGLVERSGRGSQSNAKRSMRRRLLMRWLAISIAFWTVGAACAAAQTRPSGEMDARRDARELIVMFH